MSATTKQSKNFGTGHFDVMIDKKDLTAYVKSVSGGLMKGSSVEEPHGPYQIKMRHLSTREITPIEIELGMNGTSWALQPIEDAINGKPWTRHEGEIIHADTNMTEQFSQEFKRALITEVTLPKLDAKSKDPANAKVKLQPEIIDFKHGAGNKIQPRSMDKQKMWTCNAFRLNLDGFDMSRVMSVEALTIKTGAKPYQKGGSLVPEIHPGKIEWPKLSFVMPLGMCGPLIDWYEQSVVNVGKDDQAGGYLINGSIEFLDTKHEKTLYEIDLYGIGPEAFEIVKGDANADSIKTGKFDCFITSMKVFSSKKLGFT